MTDFRALCVELTDCLEKADWPHRYKDVFQQWADISRTALAEQPVGPTDDELWAVGDEDFRANYYPTDAIKFARAVLTRWGQP